MMKVLISIFIFCVFFHLNVEAAKTTSKDLFTQHKPEIESLRMNMLNNKQKIAELLEEYKTNTDSLGKKTILSQLENLLGDQYDLRNQIRIKKLEVYERRIALAKQKLRTTTVDKKNSVVSSWKNKLLEKNIVKQ